MKRVLKGDANAEFTQQANLVGSYTISNTTTSNDCAHFCKERLPRPEIKLVHVLEETQRHEVIDLNYQIGAAK